MRQNATLTTLKFVETELGPLTPSKPPEDEEMRETLQAMARSMNENRPEGWPMVDENCLPVNGAHFQNGMVGGEKPPDRPDVWDMADQGGGGGEPSRRAAADGEGEVVAAEAADPIPDAPREWPSWPGFSEGWVSEDPPPAPAEEEESAGAEEGGEKEEEPTSSGRTG